ncbi:unnamed protein product [Trifolium pratense]|uniref:Uncharacterized protein n=1 Tax=Trifolium pratense TaxID=57577 RepID=A0ACB0JR31_TRIPR|nr:unnamed protein product [Trifolium pratense]
MMVKSKKSTFKFIKDRIWRKINSWSSRHLSQAGREIMIKSILQSIPTYVMSIFLLPSTLIDEIEKMLNSFWWGHSGNNGRGLHWLSWERLSVSKDYGGMGFKNLQAFNIAMLGKQAWNLVTKPSSLITKLLKARYFPKCDFFDSSIGHNPSYVWRSIWSSKSVVQGGCKWSIGTGENISIWEQNWLKEGMSIPIPSDMQHVGDITTRAGLWNHVNAGLNTNNNIDDNLFSVLHRLDKDQQEFFSVMVWSIWKRRNNQVWDNITDSDQTVVERARHLITSWRDAQQIRSLTNTVQTVPQKMIWVKPSHGRYKCNVDASFSLTHNKVGIGMCIRDDHGRFVAARTQWVEPILDVEHGEAIGLLQALKWAVDLQLHDIDFEMDCKRVVDSLYSKRTYFSDLGAILGDCRTILASTLVNSHVKFIRRQANEVAHRLAGAATSFGRPKNGDELSSNLFVANCGAAVGICDDDIVSVFSKFGELNGVYAADDSCTRVIVSYSEVCSAQSALMALHGQPCPQLGGRSLYIRYSVLHPNPQGPIKEDVKIRNVNTKRCLGDLPSFLASILERISSCQTFKNVDPDSIVLDQLTVNEYPPGVGLSPHIDTHSAFEDLIFSLSLAVPCIMEFRQYEDGDWRPKVASSTTTKGESPEDASLHSTPQDRQSE